MQSYSTLLSLVRKTMIKLRGTGVPKKTYQFLYIPAHKINVKKINLHSMEMYLKIIISILISFEEVPLVGR